MTPFIKNFYFYKNAFTKDIYKIADEMQQVLTLSKRGKQYLLLKQNIEMARARIEQAYTNLKTFFIYFYDFS